MMLACSCRQFNASGIVRSKHSPFAKEVFFAYATTCTVALSYDIYSIET